MLGVEANLVAVALVAAIPAAVVAATPAAAVAVAVAAAVAASFVGEAVVDAVELEGVVAGLGLRCPGVFGLEQPVSVTRRSFPLQVRQ